MITSLYFMISCLFANYLHIQRPAGASSWYVSRTLLSCLFLSCFKETGVDFSWIFYVFFIGHLTLLQKSVCNVSIVCETEKLLKYTKHTEKCFCCIEHHLFIFSGKVKPHHALNYNFFVLPTSSQ